ncbi:RING-H2 finger protein ATL78-like [Cynara cardunculus var. scolymus]|uniref:RING-type E3 ubiquitin transferase n=1 Tax=Cynara cardunculus var. scolymus TaxID=59895 RepID=A0A103XK61_CYNCS|nr:RING-H2 finger protein ATL78-like [Cynara cardunculus var. scolymus]KVH92188.1 Zinc finger, RING/FYVE/PHD-type [Cynara cardunculus var. scolymus]
MSTTSTILFHDALGHFYSRKLLLQTLSEHPAAATTMMAASSPSSSYTVHSNFDSNVVMVLSVLLCALICSLGLNSIIRCVLRCTNYVGSESSTGQESTSVRLANTGIRKKALKTFPTVSYWEGLQLPGLDKECVICLGDFSKGERVKILPKCNHGFHVRCIDKWLSSHSSCPTCRHSLLDTCQKILTGGNYPSSQPEAQGPSSTTTISIMPLQHEGLLRNYES